jgi:hypothetical protein
VRSIESFWFTIVKLPPEWILGVQSSKYV